MLGFLALSAIVSAEAFQPGPLPSLLERTGSNAHMQRSSRPTTMLVARDPSTASPDDRLKNALFQREVMYKQLQDELKKAASKAQAAPAAPPAAPAAVPKQEVAKKDDSAVQKIAALERTNKSYRAAILQRDVMMQQLKREYDKAVGEVDSVPQRVLAAEWEGVRKVLGGQVIDSVTQGEAEQVLSLLNETLTTLNVQPLVPAVRDAFDPVLHDKAEEKERRDVKPGTVLSVVEQGYWSPDTKQPIKKARVVVSKQPAPAKPAAKTASGTSKGVQVSGGPSIGVLPSLAGLLVVGVAAGALILSNAPGDIATPVQDTEVFTASVNKAMSSIQELIEAK
ncbi:unnamed protein product [Vitrella brassicaformis CCMP3155]|uniref:GrpE protein homolog n=1 Tax=Vitrella brassicaformis (strain CCMP3155) TaxID=1169540 RepID=A0A0G4EQP1_VITBC|nr:unnamed protein product [Vitrella brassicaformis CCMP3155]|eukprot:CEL99558.1 unnamed protein product [Vitrella brassicaformis CCMP3155]